METEYILCAAIHYNDALSHKYQPKNIKKGYVVSGRRHHNCIALHSDLTGKDTTQNDVQGFLTSHDRFLTRKSAAKVAFKAKQITEPNSYLISEDLYPHPL